MAQTPSDDLSVLLSTALDARGEAAAAWAIVSQLLAAGKPSIPLAILYARMAPRFNRAEAALNLIQELLSGAEAGTATQRASLHFCAASLLDALGRYDEAFTYAKQAHALRPGSYDAARTERLVRDWMTYFTPPTIRRLPRGTQSTRKPVFVVGMPRSGTTLVEQILCSHPEVYGAGELTWIFALWQSAARRVSSPTATLIDCLDRLDSSTVNELAAEYLRPLEALSPRSARIIDKLPMNLLNLGLIAILFPQSRVIYCRRHPIDICLSCYMTDFAAGSEFCFDLSSSAHLYRHSEMLMSHWRRVLDLPIMEVRYEHVVADLEVQARRMIDFLELPWDDHCLHFYENPRLVATASSSQVHSPVYDRSVGRWHHYEGHLQPLRHALVGLYGADEV